MSKIIKFKNEFASADLVIWNNSSATISNLYSRKRCCGYGSNILSQITTYADENNIQLILRAAEYGRHANSDNSRLVQFYEKFGFEILFHENGEPSDIMIR